MLNTNEQTNILITSTLDGISSNFKQISLWPSHREFIPSIERYNDFIEEQGKIIYLNLKNRKKHYLL